MLFRELFKLKKFNDNVNRSLVKKVRYHTNIEIEHDVDEIFEEFYKNYYDLLPEESSDIKSHVITYNNVY